MALSPEIVLEENTDIEAWDAVIENNDKLLEDVYKRQGILTVKGQGRGKGGARHA